MENEIMNNDVMEVTEVIVEDCGKVGFVKPTLIVAGAAVAGFGLYKLGKKVWENYKAKKAQAEDEPKVI